MIRVALDSFGADREAAESLNELDELIDRANRRVVDDLSARGLDRGARVRPAHARDLALRRADRRPRRRHRRAGRVPGDRRVPRALRRLALAVVLRISPALTRVDRGVGDTMRPRAWGWIGLEASCLPPPPHLVRAVDDGCLDRPDLFVCGNRARLHPRADSSPSASHSFADFVPVLPHRFGRARLCALCPDPPPRGLRPTPPRGALRLPRPERRPQPDRGGLPNHHAAGRGLAGPPASSPATEIHPEIARCRLGHTSATNSRSRQPHSHQQHPGLRGSGRRRHERMRRRLPRIRPLSGASGYEDGLGRRLPPERARRRTRDRR